MTVSSSTSKARYEGNGSTDTFAFSGRIFSSQDLAVEIITRATDDLVETLTLTTDYTVTINSSESSSVQVTNALKIPTSTQDIQIRRVLEPTQDTRLPTGTPFPSSKVEGALDKLTASMQDVTEELSRSIKVPANFSVTTLEITDVPVDGYGLVWDGVNGDLRNTTSSLATLEGDAAIVAANMDMIELAADLVPYASDIEALAPVASDIAMIIDNIDDLQVVADALSDSIASGITYSHTTSGLAATNVQTAIDELASEKLNAVFASEEEAEAGTAEDKPMNALRTAQAIAALSLAQQSGSATDGQVLTADGSGGSAWETAAVTSVAGKTGVVTLDKADVGLSNVANVNTTVASNITSGILPGARLPQGDDSLGSYALMENVSGSQISGGSTQAGSGLRHAIFTSAGALDGGTSAGAGTWENMSKDPIATGGFGLFQRIS